MSVAPLLVRWLPHRGLAAAVLGVCALLLASGGAPALGARSADWVEGSEGLDVPGMDEGDSEFEFADVNADGYLDIVSVGDHGNPGFSTAGDEHGILVWLGDGRSHWSHRHYGELGYGGVAAGDVNGDGIVDVGYGIHHNYSGVDLGDQLLEVALGDGSGEFWTAWDDGLASHGEAWGMFASDFGDVDADGDLDLGSNGFGGSGGVQVYFNRMDGSWERAWGYLGSNNYPQFYFGDIDGDGALDIACSREDGTVWLGDGDGFFEPADANLPAPPLVGLGIGDVDGDGRDDISFCDDASNAEVWVRVDDGWQNVSAGLSPTAICERTQLADMDGDGSVDLVETGHHEVFIHAGAGGAGWSEIEHLSTPEDTGHMRALRAGPDVDHNGRGDLILMATRTHGIFDPENVMHLYRESSNPTELALRIRRPGPGRVLLGGQVRFVEWSSAIPGGDAGTARIELSTEGGEGPWETLAESIPNAGLWQWRVPPRYGEDCRLRVTIDTAAGQASATSGAPFAIRHRPDRLDLRVVDNDTIEWSDGLGRDRWNLYRGDLEHYLATGEASQDPLLVPEAGRWCDLASTTEDDPHAPPPGKANYYLVTAYHLMEDGTGEPGSLAAMGESPLGQRSDATMRRNAEPCPR